jgi:serine/threonine protein kinase
VPFFTMEYLKGETLASYASRCGKLPEGEILELAAQILAGLSALHAAGIIHRDLKPENVFLLEPTSGPRRVVVMDFGLARPLDRESAFVSSQDASTPGTPAYMAPEQALGKPATIESDIYAFGVILYRLVTGQLPFKGNTSVALAVARLQDSAPPVARAAPGVSSQLGSIVDRCLERDPRRRYVAVSEIQRAFDWSRAPAQPKRRRVSTVLYLCASVALVASLFAIQRARSGNSVSPATPQRAAVPQKIRDTPATVARAAAPITAVAPPGSVAVAGEARVASSRHWVRQRPAPSPPAASSSAMKALTHDVPEAAASTSLPVTPNDDDILIPSFAGTPPPSPNAGGP